LSLGFVFAFGLRFVDLERVGRFLRGITIYLPKRQNIRLIKAVPNLVAQGYNRIAKEQPIITQQKKDSVMKILTFNPKEIAASFLADTQDDLTSYKEQREALVDMSLLVKEIGDEAVSFVENEIAAQDQAIYFLEGRVSRLISVISHISEGS
jgi:hypothetical protein